MSLAGKNTHYVELDGLRGIAALSVAFFHTQTIFGGRWFFGHGYLAVDFFYLLSGFVLHHAYYERLRGGGISSDSRATVQSG